MGGNCPRRVGPEHSGKTAVRSKPRGPSAPVIHKAACGENFFKPGKVIAREVAAFLDHEFEQERRAGLGHADRFLDARNDVARLLDPARGNVEALGDLGVVAADRHRAVLLVGDFQHVALGAHDAVVEHHGQDRDLVARRRLDIHAGHADGGVAHHVDAELFRLGELGAHGDAEAVAELRGLAPAHVGAGRRGLPERHHLLARLTGIVRHDDVVAVERPHQVADDTILVERRLVGIEEFRPFVEPRLLGRRRSPP